MGERRHFRLIAVVAALAVGATVVGAAQPSDSSPVVEAQPVDPCSGEGLRNSGFEDGVVGGDPSCWDVVDREDRVEVVGTEGPADSAVYAEKDITVAPPLGSSMLALGNPKQNAESQANAPDVVEQEFVATSEAFQLQFRIFSWEPAGNDIVEVSIEGGDGAATTSLTLEDTPTYTDGSCAAGACSFTIDTGRRNEKRLIDTDWRVATFSGLVAGQTYTTQITIGGTKRTSFATWGYVDDVNSPPVARFDLDRPDDCTFAPFGTLYEGQPIPLNDCSYDPDGQIVEREWKITFPALPDEPAITEATSGFIFPDDEGTYIVELTVTDNDGLTDTVTVGSGGDCTLTDGADTSPGAPASDGTCLPALVVENAPPLVDVVDVQAVAGSDVEIVARYGDAGIFDEHSVTVAGATATGPQGDGCSGDVALPCFDEDDLPAVETGIVKGATTAPDAGQTIDVPVSVTDEATGPQPAGNSTTVDVARITGISADPLQFEPAADADDISRPVALGGRYADWIDQPGDIDLFRVEWPGTDGANKPLPVGTELLVSLRDLPADFDVAVLKGRTEGTAPGQIAPGQIAPGQIAPGQIAPGQIAPGQIAPGQIAPGQIAPGQIAPGQIAPGQIAPGQIAPGQIATLYRAPGQIAPGQIAPGQIAPGQIAPGQIASLYDLVSTTDGLAPYDVNPFQLYPLSLRAYTDVDGTNLSGTDVDIDELGLGEFADGLEVAAYSANDGLDNDTVLVRVDEPGTAVYVVVIGANGEFSNVEPYGLQVEGSAPFDSAVLAAGQLDSTKLQLFGGTCQREFRGGAGTSTITQSSSGDSPTLFVTSRDRLGYVDPTGTEIAWPKIEQLAAEVGGSILDVRSPAFADWDAATCDPVAANAVAEDVRDAVQAELASGAYEYVVVVGGDDVIPFRRVVDETAYANETQYVSSSFLQPGQPLFASKAGGFNLTDAHLTDAVPTPWRGRSLWVGDFPTSRLVETETEIAAQVDAYLGSDGSVDLGTTALVTGSEFFDDGAEAVASALEAGGATVNRLIDGADSVPGDLATADEYLCSVFGVAAACGAVDPPSSVAINDINAHYLHFATFSPRGSNAADPAEVIGSTAVAAGAPGAGIAAGSFYLTIGCHGGLPVPDDEVQIDEVADGLRPGLDWAQALAQQQAVMIGNTGFGLGDDAGVAYTELLHQYIAEALTEQPTVGDALVAAQQRYLASVTLFDEYHEKTMIQTTMFGLAFYSIPETPSPSGFASTAQLADAPATPSAAELAALTATETFTATVSDGDISTPIASTLRRVTEAPGSYYAGDDVLRTSDRPKQPVVLRDLGETPAGGNAVHGVLIRGAGTELGNAGTYSDESGFDPVIHVPTSEWLREGREPQVCLDAWWPSTLAQVNTQELPGGELSQTLAIKPGQFRCESGTAAPVTGTQRLFDGLPVELQRSSSNDWKAPVVRQVDFEAGEADGSLAITMRLDDSSDLDEIVVLRLLDEEVTSQNLGFVTADDGQTISFELAGLRPEEGILIQLVDEAGNVTLYTAKSTIPSVLEIEASAPAFALTGEPVTLTVTIPQYVQKVADGRIVEDVYFSWDFGATVLLDGEPRDRTSGIVDPASPDIEFNAAGDAVIDVTVVYDDTAPDPIVATARVVDSDGGIGVDRVMLRPACDAANLPDLPDADIVGCGIDLDAVTGAGDPAVGFTVAVVGVISPDYQYRIGFDTRGGVGVDKTVKYSDGQVTGPIDATAELNEAGDALLITVPLDEVTKKCPGDPKELCVIWQLETQAGVAGGPGQGFLDQARDELTVTPVS